MKRTLFRALALMLMVILLTGSAAFPGAAAAGGYTAAVSDGAEGTATVSVGDEVTIRITVLGDSFNGLQGVFHFDKAVFELKSVSGPALDDDPDTEEIELYLLSDATYSDGAEIFTAVFAAKAQGTGVFTLDAVTVGDYEDFRSGDAAPAAIVADEVYVKGSSGGDVVGVVGSNIVVTPRDSSLRAGGEGMYLPDGSIYVSVWNGDGKVVSSLPGGVWVMIPNVTDGQVVVQLNNQGKIIDLVEKSLVESGKAYTLLPGTARIKIIDNAKPFEDVKEADWFNEFVIFASSHELFIGVDETHFAPQMNMSRAMMVTVLWRLEDRPEADSVSSFTDMERNSWYDAAVDWAAENGVTLGYSDEEFGPRDDVTREQMATLLYRYLKDLGFDVSASGDYSVYADGDEVSAWASEAMHWAIGSGLLIGRSDTILAPRGTATRAEVATMFKRLVTIMVKP